jgi:glyoxylase-like metal-dependent hydrolase (beta-lactamase superfamily II)
MTSTLNVNVWVTHMHIDHYGGLSVLRRHFPDARAIATPKSVELMPKTPEELAVYRKTDFGRLKKSTTSDHELRRYDRALS